MSAFIQIYPDNHFNPLKNWRRSCYWWLWLVMDVKVTAFMFVCWKMSGGCGEISVPYTLFFLLIPGEIDCWCIIRWIFISTEIILVLFYLMAGWCSTEMLVWVGGSDLWWVKLLDCILGLVIYYILGASVEVNPWPKASTDVFN